MVDLLITVTLFIFIYFPFFFQINLLAFISGFIFSVEIYEKSEDFLLFIALHLNYELFPICNSNSELNCVLIVIFLFHYLKGAALLFHQNQKHFVLQSNLFSASLIIFELL